MNKSKKKQPQNKIFLKYEAVSGRAQRDYFRYGDVHVHGAQGWSISTSILACAAVISPICHMGHAAVSPAVSWWERIADCSFFLLMLLFDSAISKRCSEARWTIVGEENEAFGQTAAQAAVIIPFLEFTAVSPPENQFLFVPSWNSFLPVVLSLSSSPKNDSSGWGNQEQQATEQD